eukprot:1158699-Pelagomonas_calceolata.AAC.5
MAAWVCAWMGKRLPLKGRIDGNITAPCSGTIALGLPAREQGWVWMNVKGGKNSSSSSGGISSDVVQLILMPNRIADNT